MAFDSGNTGGEYDLKSKETNHKHQNGLFQLKKTPCSDGKDSWWC